MSICSTECQVRMASPCLCLGLKSTEAAAAPEASSSYRQPKYTCPGWGHNLFSFVTGPSTPMRHGARVGNSHLTCGRAERRLLKARALCWGSLPCLHLVSVEHKQPTQEGLSTAVTTHPPLPPPSLAPWTAKGGGSCTALTASSRSPFGCAKWQQGTVIPCSCFRRGRSCWWTGRKCPPG